MTRHPRALRRRLAAGTIVLALASGVAAPVSATQTATGTPQPSVSRVDWSKWSGWGSLGVKYRTYSGYSDAQYGKNYFHFKRRKRSNGARQVRVRWWYEKVDPKPGKRKKRVRRIKPGGQRFIRLHLRPCAHDGTYIDWSVRRNKKHRPHKWRKWRHYGFRSVGAICDR